MAGALFGVNEEFGVLLQLYALGNFETDQERQQYLKQFNELAGTVAIVTALGLAAAVFTAGTSYVAVRFGIKGLLLAFMRKASKYIDKLPLDSIIRKLFDKVFNSLLKSRWYKSTFNCVEDSWKHHLQKHGKGRSIDEYTKAAEEFWEKYKHLGVKQTL